MKIAHYLREVDLEAGGVVRAVLDWCHELSALGHEVTLMTCDDKDVPEGWGAEGRPRVVVLPVATGKLGRFRASELERARGVIGEADVLHLHTPWDSTNPQLAEMARTAGTGYIVSVHGMLDDWSMSQRTLKKKLYLALTGRKFLEGAAVVLCTAAAEKMQAAKWCGKKANLEVVPLVFDVSPFRELPGRGPAEEAFAGVGAGDEFLMLFLSRIHVKKGVEVFVDTVARLRKDGRKVRGLIAGSGDEVYLAAMREHAQEADVAEHVDFLGMVGGREKISLYESADVFALPTSQENFGFVLPEALACGTPVITTKGVDIWPELEGSGGALIVDRDSVSFAGAVAKLMDDDSLREKMGAAGREWVLRELPGEVVSKRYEALYARVAGVGG